jgi:hypothetical protein
VSNITVPYEPCYCEVKVDSSLLIKINVSSISYSRLGEVI